MRCHKWLHVAHSIAQRKKVQPPRGSIHLTSFTRGSLLSSATPGYRKHNPDGVAPSLTIDCHITRRGWCTIWHLSPHHHMGCGNAITWDCAPHGHSSPSHGIGMVRIMAIYHRTITWSMTIPSRGIAHRIAIYCQATP